MGIDLRSPKLKDIVFNLVEVSKSVAQDPPTKLLALYRLFERLKKETKALANVSSLGRELHTLCRLIRYRWSKKM